MTEATKEEQIIAAKGAIADKAADEKRIHEEIIKAQTAIARVTNMIDAFGTEHSSNESNAQIYIWTQSIDGSIKKAKGAARSNLIDDKIAKTMSVGRYNVDVTFTTAGLSLDTVKFKKLDSASYASIAKLFPKRTTTRASIKVTEKKGI